MPGLYQEVFIFSEPHWVIVNLSLVKLLTIQTQLTLLHCRFFGMSIGVAVGRCLGGQLLQGKWTVTSITIFFLLIFFYFPFSVTTFSHRRNARIKKT